MSDESDVTAPEPEAPASPPPDSAPPGSAPPGSAPPGSEPADVPSADSPAPAPAPAPPSTSRRKPLIIGFAAGILVAAVIVPIVLVVARPGAQRLKYAGLPAPCALVTAATLAKYMPDATSGPQGTPSSSTDQEGACSWSSITGGQDRSLLVQVDVFGSSSGLTTAQQAYQREVSGPACCRGLKISTRPVTGLGDQATALVITQSQITGGTSLPPDAALVVLSGNAEIEIGFTDLPFTAPPSRATKLAADIAMARDVLAALPA